MDYNYKFSYLEMYIKKNLTIELCNKGVVQAFPPPTIVVKYQNFIFLDPSLFCLLNSRHSLGWGIFFLNLDHGGNFYSRKWQAVSVVPNPTHALVTKWSMDILFSVYSSYSLQNTFVLNFYQVKHSCFPLLVCNCRGVVSDPWGLSISKCFCCSLIQQNCFCSDIFIWSLLLPSF